MANEGTFPQDIHDALDEFNKESDRINDAIGKKLASNGELPPLIYHYTNDLGLRGILETGVFWLTDIFHLTVPPASYRLLVLLRWRWYG